MYVKKGTLSVLISLSFKMMFKNDVENHSLRKTPYILESIKLTCVTQLSLQLIKTPRLFVLSTNEKTLSFKIKVGGDWIRLRDILIAFVLALFIVSQLSSAHADIFETSMFKQADKSFISEGVRDK